MSSSVSCGEKRRKQCKLIIFNRLRRRLLLLGNLCSLFELQLVLCRVCPLFYVISTVFRSQACTFCVSPVFPQAKTKRCLCVCLYAWWQEFSPLTTRKNEWTRRKKATEQIFNFHDCVELLLFSTFSMISWVNYWITCFLFNVALSLCVLCSAFCHRNNATVNEAREECFNVAKGYSSIVCWSCIKTIRGWFEALKGSVHKLCNLLHFK